MTAPESSAPEARSSLGISAERQAVEHAERYVTQLVEDRDKLKTASEKEKRKKSFWNYFWVFVGGFLLGDCALNEARVGQRIIHAAWAVVDPQDAPRPRWRSRLARTLDEEIRGNRRTYDDDL